MEGLQVQSLGLRVWELRASDYLQPENQNVKQKQYYNKFKKDFKNGPHQKKEKEKKEYSGIRGREKARMIPRA